MRKRYSGGVAFFVFLLTNSQLGLAQERATKPDHGYVIVAVDKAQIVFLDVRTLVPDGDSVTAWTVSAYYPSASFPSIGSVSYTVTQSVYNCRIRTSAVNYVVAYDEENKILHSGQMSATPSPVIPESIGEIVFKAACTARLPTWSVSDADTVPDVRGAVRIAQSVLKKAADSGQH